MNESSHAEKKIIVITRAFGTNGVNDYKNDHEFNEVTAHLLAEEPSDLTQFLKDNGAEEGSTFLHYKKLNGRDIYLLPCYKEVYEEKHISYEPLRDREKLLSAIAKQFNLQKNQTNELYIHDTEWGSPFYDYNALSELKGEKKEEILQFFSGIYVFAHSPVSEYFRKIVKGGFSQEVLQAINYKRDFFITIENGGDLPEETPQPDTLEAIASFAKQIIES